MPGSIRLSSEQPRRRFSSRLSRFAVWTGAVAVFLILSSTNEAAQQPRFKTSAGGDTVVLWGPEWLECFGTVNFVNYNNQFTADTVIGKRFLIECGDGASFTSIKVSADSQEYVAQGGGVGAIDIGTTGTHDFKISLKGPVNGGGFFRVVRVDDPTFPIYPTDAVSPFSDYRGFRRWKGATVTFRDTFHIPPGGGSPYTIRVMNGLAPPTSPDTNHVTNGTIKLNRTQVISSGDFGATVAAIERNISPSSLDTLDVTMNLPTTGDTAATNPKAIPRLKIRVSATDTTAPTLSVSSPSVDTTFTTATKTGFAGTVSDDATPGLVGIVGQTLFRFNLSTSFTDTATIVTDSKVGVAIQATNSARLSSTIMRWVVLDRTAPTLVVSTPSSGGATTTDSIYVVTGYWRDSTTTTVTVDKDTISLGKCAYGDTFSYAYPLDYGPNRVLVRAIDRLGNTTQYIRTVTRFSGGEQSGPTLTASTLSTTGITPFYNAVRFLFTGSSPIQTIADTSDLQPDLIGVVRGRVLGRDFGPIANVTVSVLGGDSLGSTVTRNDGSFDLAVNGGRQYTLCFRKSKYLESQRKIMVPANDYAVLDDVALIGITARFSVVDLDSASVARGRFATDTNGDRDVRLIFRPGTRARIKWRSGGGLDSAQFSKIRVRATEYTVGQDGQESMPGELPPSSAYTYCFDLRTDESDSIAIAVGKSYLTTYFTDTVSCYVRNFLHYPVGAYIPLGFYDAESGKWVSESDGVVLKILDTTGTTPRIDSNGDGISDGQARLDSLGITTTELVKLRGQFAAGDTVWRMRMTHFSRPDANFVLAGLINALTKLGARAAKIALDLLSPCLGKGSIIECESRVLRERIPIAGTPYSLNYRSARAQGDHAVRSIHLPLFRDPPPANLLGVIVRLDVAGQRIERSISNPSLGDTVNIGWDGNDAYGRPVLGSVIGRLGIGYQYPMFTAAGSGGNSWADAAAGGSQSQFGTGERSNGMVRWNYQEIVLGAAEAGSDGLGGWTISPHHFYDPKGNGTLYLGDGSVVSGEMYPPTISHIAGNDVHCGGGFEPSCTIDDVLATQAPLKIRGIARGPDGLLYVADNRHGSIYKIDASGYLRRVAGTGTATDFTTGGPALSCGMRDFGDLAVAPDGTIYFTLQDDTNSNNNIVGRVTTAGYVEKIIGGNSGTDGTGDGGRVQDATVRLPQSIAIGPDGSIFIGDSYYSSNKTRIRRITPDGRILAYAGKAGSTVSPDGSYRALDLILYKPTKHMVVDGDGALYITESGQRIWRVTPDGNASTARSALGINSGEYPIALHPEGGLYVGDPHTAPLGVFHLGSDSTLTLIAGGGPQSLKFGYPALSVTLSAPLFLVANDDGSYYMALLGSDNDIIVKVAKTLGRRDQDEYVVSDPSGSVIYYFSLAGRHVRTRDGVSGTVLNTFGYDNGGRLTSIRDVYGDSTTIQRDGSGNPTSITGPFGQTTTLGISSGFLSTVTFNSEVYSLTTSTSTSSYGLLTGFEDPEDRSHTFSYDGTGRLEADTDAESKSQSLSEPVIAGDVRSNHRDSPLGRRTAYEVTTNPDGTVHRKVTGPEGFEAVTVDSAALKTFAYTPDGLVQEATIAPDSILGLVAAFSRLSYERFPSPDLRRKTEVLRARTPGTWSEVTSINDKPFTRVFVKTGNAADTLRMMTPLGRTTQVVVDSAGQPRMVLAPGVDPLELTAGNHGRITMMKQGSRIWTYAYDGRGRLEFVRDTLGRMTRFGYDASDRPRSQTMPNGDSVQVHYDKVNQINTLTTGAGNAHTYAYKKTGQALRYTPPAVAGIDSTATTYSFNDDQQCTSVREAGGKVVSLGYNSSKGRLDSVTVDRGRGTFSYSSSTGQLETLGSPDSVFITYAYNGPLVKNEQWSGAMPGGTTPTISRVFDQFLRDSVETISGTSAITYSYDGDGFLTGAGPLAVERRADNGAVHSTQVSDGGGTIQSLVGYDVNGDVDSLQFTHSGQGLLFQQVLTRDAIGSVTQVSEVAFGTSRTWGYRYDLAGRLYGVTLSVNGGATDTVARYLYDRAGNRLSFRGLTAADTATADYDAQDRLRRWGNVEYTYTPAGRLKQAIVGGSTTNYRYDVVGNLTSVLFQSGDSVSYLVDGLGRRVGRKWNGQWTNGWIYSDILHPAAQLDAAGGAENRYIYGGDRDAPSLIIRSGAVYRLITDYLGTVRGVVLVSSGTVAQRLRCDAWGVPEDTLGVSLQALGFASGIVDAATGIERFGARDYAPANGRWTSRDPLGRNIEAPNAYVYADNDPIGNIDPLGLKTRRPCPLPFPLPNGFSVGYSITGTVDFERHFTFGAGFVFTHGHIYFQDQAGVLSGPGLYYGAAAQIAGSRYDEPPQVGPGHVNHAEGNFGYGPEGGGGFVEGAGSRVTSIGIGGKYGVGAGIMRGVGVLDTYTRRIK